MKNFWSQIWNAEWIADTGLPLLLSLIALYVAYRFLKAQFKHDRNLWRPIDRRRVPPRRALGHITHPVANLRRRPAG
ncbi:hypothetical protein ABT116_43560, partial [Streptomyces sp. NPDC002130]|uniref:hypothetical protein n=1 Tax=Streptomyces sp. NPDC002130 TaxID=3155568 RepID=UPI00331AB999